MTQSQTQIHTRGRIAASCLLAALVLGACSKPVEPMVGVASTPQAPAASAGEPNVADAEVTTHVKTALASDAVLKAFDITVVTQKGDVRLTGVLDTPLQIADAIRIARTSDGVHSIHDELTLKK